MTVANLTGIDPATDIAIIDAVENPELRDRAIALINSDQDRISGVVQKALDFALLGEYDLAIQDMEKGLEAGDPYSIWVNQVQLYDPLREDPRFQAILKQLNFEP